MKFDYLIIALLINLIAYSQKPYVPSKRIIDKKLVKNEQYKMKWYLVRDTLKKEVGIVSTEIQINKQRILVITKAEIKGSTKPWIDTTVARLTDMSPIYHSSFNEQRNMVLNFDKIVTGYYIDKIFHSNTTISDTTHQKYFDSNLYITMLKWIPFKEGYSAVLNIYDYNPKTRSGIMKATIHEVKSGKFLTERKAEKDIWIIKVSDEIGGLENGTSYYYIDKYSRTLYKQEIDYGSRKMIMEFIEH